MMFVVMMLGFTLLQGFVEPIHSSPKGWWEGDGFSFVCNETYEKCEELATAKFNTTYACYCERTIPLLTPPGYTGPWIEGVHYKIEKRGYEAGHPCYAHCDNELREV